MNGASVTQLGYLGIGVSDVAKWETFATQTLGLQANGQDKDGALFLRMDEYHHRFVIHPAAEDDVIYVGWEVKDEESLVKLSEQLKAGGVPVAFADETEARARGVVGLIKFQDPDGIQTEAFYGPLMSFDNPFKSPRAISGFETGPMGLGHIVLSVDHFEKSLHFYRDLLGMKVSDFADFELKPGVRLFAGFFHCNPRHHSLAIVPIPAKKKLRHFMLQTKSLDDVGATYYLCEDQGVPITLGLGRHTNDHMVSFYIDTPSGFEVEYGWGAREVDDNVWQVQTHQSASIWGHRPVGS